MAESVVAAVDNATPRNPPKNKRIRLSVTEENAFDQPYLGLSLAILRRCGYQSVDAAMIEEPPARDPLFLRRRTSAMVEHLKANCPVLGGKKQAILNVLSVRGEPVAISHRVPDRTLGLRKVPFGRPANSCGLKIDLNAWSTGIDSRRTPPSLHESNLPAFPKKRRQKLPSKAISSIVLEKGIAKLTRQAHTSSGRPLRYSARFSEQPTTNITHHRISNGNYRAQNARKFCRRFSWRAFNASTLRLISA